MPSNAPRHRDDTVPPKSVPNAPLIKLRPFDVLLLLATLVFLVVALAIAIDSQPDPTPVSTGSDRSQLGPVPANLSYCWAPSDPCSTVQLDTK